MCLNPTYRLSSTVYVSRDVWSNSSPGLSKIQSLSTLARYAWKCESKDNGSKILLQSTHVLSMLRMYFICPGIFSTCKRSTVNTSLTVYAILSAVSWETCWIILPLKSISLKSLLSLRAVWRSMGRDNKGVQILLPGTFSDLTKILTGESSQDCLNWWQLLSVIVMFTKLQQL